MKQKTLNTMARIAIVAALVLAPALPVSAKDKNTNKRVSEVAIENFGQTNDHIYRGGQPKGEDFKKLASIGIKTIVDLREDAERGVQAAAQSAGLRYINLPMAPKSYPKPEAAQRFLEIANDQANWPLYVHCAGGKHRTGAMIAVYRMTVDKWSIEKAYDEMKDYDFYTSWGHGCYKDYVFDYARQQSRVAQQQHDSSPDRPEVVRAPKE